MRCRGRPGSVTPPRRLRARERCQAASRAERAPGLRCGQAGTVFVCVAGPRPVAVRKTTKPTGLPAPAAARARNADLAGREGGERAWSEHNRGFAAERVRIGLPSEQTGLPIPDGASPILYAIETARPGPPGSGLGVDPDRGWTGRCGAQRGSASRLVSWAHRFIRSAGPPGRRNGAGSELQCQPLGRAGRIG